MAVFREVQHQPVFGLAFDYSDGFSVCVGKFLFAFRLLFFKFLNDFLNIKADVRLVLPKTLPRFEGKAKRVIDKRVF